jgi:hypothetical protein
VEEGVEEDNEEEDEGEEDEMMDVLELEIDPSIISFIIF